jgi:hypothetical protein
MMNSNKPIQTIIYACRKELGLSPKIEIGKLVELTSRTDTGQQESNIQIIWPDGSIEIHDTQTTPGE